MQVMSVFDINIPPSVTAAAALDQATPPEVRLQSLRLLARQHPDAPERRPVLTELLGDKSQPALRIESVKQLITIDPAAGIAAAGDLITGGRVAEQQAAVAQLAAAQHPEADVRLAALLTPAGDASGAAPGIRLDVLEAAAVRASTAPALAAALVARTKTLEASTDLQGALTDCVTGGDPAAGKEIALNHLAANCVACHRFQRGRAARSGRRWKASGGCIPPRICWKPSPVLRRSSRQVMAWPR